MRALAVTFILTALVAVASVPQAGVAFFDVMHFQRGRSRSCVELHPVLSIESAAE